MALSEIDRHGFAIIPHVLRQNDLNDLSEWLASANINRSRAGARHVLRYDPVAKIARAPRLLQLAQQVLGESAFPFRATLFDKTPKSNWLVSWHQDTALPLRERRDVPGWGPWSTKDGVTYAHAPAEALTCVLALRIHLDDSRQTNGPLRVLPGTHNNGVLDDDTIRQLARQIASTTCPCRAGDVLAMRPLVIHSSSKSVSVAPRRVLHIEYSACPEFDDLHLAVA